MELVFCCEAVFQSSNGKYYSETAPFGMGLWSRYLKVFDRITLIVRVVETDTPSQFEIDAEKVHVVPLPRYKGLVETIKSQRLVHGILKPQAKHGRAYILRVPGQIGSTFAAILHRQKIPFGIEVVGDPWDVMESIGGKLAFLLKRIGFYQLRKVARLSNSALYVTQQQLQKRYPAASGIPTFAASNVKVDKAFYANSFKKYSDTNPTFNLVAIGSLEQLYKAPDVVIAAISQLKKEGCKVILHWLGGGKYQKEMETLAGRLDVSDCVCFYGNVSRDVVEAMLQSSDLFIHVSRTEGLPRAIIEAMAKGLPVVGSNVGGIPELLSKEAIVSANDVNGLVDKIKQFINDHAFYNAQSKRNLLEARKYEDSILTNIRNDFYNHVKSISAQ